ncbi:MAG: glycosyltransferase [Rhizobiales bacterium]|nr:glycosyltransferase [Hyphomicrobiales bacterium]
MSDRPSCSVIVPTYNRMHTLPRAVASVLAQDERDFEIIIVDDASTDDTQVWLDAQSDPRIRVVRSERNLGPSGARNLGLATARAPITAFLDSDDFYRPNRLSVPLAAFAHEPDLVCTLSSSIKHEPKETNTALLQDVKLASPAFEWALLCDLVGVETTSITVRTEAARAAGGFCERLRRTEDREFLIRLARLGTGRLLPEILWEKSWIADSLSNEWTGAGRDLIAYVGQRPEYTERFRKLGHYFATKILVADLRRLDFPTLAGDLRRFRVAGLLKGNFAQLWRDHREVRKYRRRMRGRYALTALKGPPLDWR